MATSVSPYELTCRSEDDCSMQRAVDERLLGASISTIAAAHPHRQALIFGDRSWSYAEFDHAVGVTAAGLSGAGVRRGDFVLMGTTARPEALFTLFALARLGAVLVPVHDSSTESEVRAVSAAVPLAATVGGADFLRRVGASGRRLCWDAETPDTTPLRPDADLEPAVEWHSAPEDVAIVALTSGTSGRPKGVVLTHQNLHWGVRSALETLGIGPDDTVLIATPLAHVAAFAGLPLYAWTVGGTVVLAPRFDPDLFIDAVHECGVTIAFAVAVMLARLVRSPRWTGITGSTLRWLLVGGGPPVESLNRPFLQAGITLVNSYGMTEASAGVTYAGPEDVVESPLSAGRPARHIELRIAETDGRAAGTGVAGEIWLRGPSVAREYLLLDGARIPAVDSAGWLHTGDRGLLDGAGRLFVHGRIDDTIVTGGENVDPAEVEDVLTAMAGVRDVAVVGLPHPEWGELVAAVIVPDAGSTASLDAIRGYLEPRLARHKIPRRLVLADDLPRTATGKLRRAEVVRSIVETRDAR
jgi:fatty-acyl-CoA synthase